MKRNIVAAALSLLAARASACGIEQVSIQNFSSEIDKWSDGSGDIVRLTGDIRSACTSPSRVEILIEARESDGRIIRQTPAWLNVPAGGMPFDLAGAVPYDPRAANYEMSIAQVR